MKLRLFIIISAIVLPLAATGLLLYFSKGVGQTAAPNETQALQDDGTPENIVGMSTVPNHLPALEPTIDSTVPDTLGEARQQAKDRLAELKKFTQAQWNIERQLIPERNPPEAIEDAVARAQLRVDDLMKLKEQDWSAERQRMEALEKNRTAWRETLKLRNKELSESVEKLFQELELDAAQ